MNRRRRNERGSAVLTALVLAVSGIYLALRCWSAVQAMTAPPPRAEVASPEGSAALVAQAEARDGMPAQAGPPERDPFHRVRVTPPRPARTTRAAPAEPALPVLRMILYDEIRPEVQFSVDGDLSGRLHPGQSFRGWTVRSISTRSCVVEKDGRSLTLTPRR
jgi:hypothetical protein